MCGTETVPRVSAILPTWNCAQFVRDEFHSLLRQDASGPMEIIVSGDCSCDETFAIVSSEAAAYRGP
jgi:glycosyltransferase involved in cell wall biosynthesis